jgi:hypothetical protein
MIAQKPRTAASGQQRMSSSKASKLWKTMPRIGIALAAISSSDEGPRDRSRTSLIAAAA